MIPPEETLSLPDGDIVVRWRRNARARRIVLRVDPGSGVVLVTLPPRGSRAAGLRLLADHAGWVRSRLIALPSAIALQDGALVPINGVAHRIRHMPQEKGGAWIEAGEIRVAGEPAFLPRRVTDLLRSEAKKRIGLIVQHKAAVAGLQPKRIALKDTRSRWGSCTVEGVLMFSWRLLMAPPFVQDYVAAHEVAHLQHMNHSPSFWQLVRQLTAHTDTATNWLRRDGPGLMRIGLVS